MLQIRQKDGRTVQAPDGAFVEMVDREGRIGSVWFQSGRQITRVRPGTPEAARYADMFGVKFSEREYLVEL